MKTKLLILICIAILFSSCASIMTGSKQSVTFNSKPQQASIYVDGISKGTTPVTVKIPRKSKIVEMRKDGYSDVTQQFVRGTNGAYWGNFALLLGGLIMCPIGMWIDIGSGAAYKITNDNIYIELPEKTK